MDITEIQNYVKGWPDGRLNSPSLFVEKLYEAGFSSPEIKLILDAIDSTCNYCWDSEDICYCMNDE